MTGLVGGKICRYLSMQNSQCAVGGTAHASDHTVRLWMLTLSNCVKPYLTSYQVVSHHQLPYPAFCFPEQAPRAQARVTWRKWGRIGLTAPGASPRRPEENAAVSGEEVRGRASNPAQSRPSKASLPPNTLRYSAEHVQRNRWTRDTYNGVHNKMNKYNTIPDESLGGQHSRDGCQSLSRNTDILQVRHTLPAAQFL